ncbi:MAG: tRNA guanosine(34) transglycosylase Tgt [Pseudomonadota bacterium]
MHLYDQFSFEIKHQSPSSKARLGRITTPHGIIETPAFIFCATKAAIKGITPQQMRSCDTQIILSNTYHLMLQPGGELVAKLGGLHKFMGWDGPMFTDSGGYQIFSLGHGSVSEEIKGRRTSHNRRTLKTITEEGARFRSYIDGSYHTLTPEKSIQIQRQLGADLIVVLDECTPFNVDKSYTEKSLHLSHRWALRSLDEFKRKNDGKQALYGIIQGGVYPDLRSQAANFVNDQNFFAHAVGGSLGANKEQMYDITEHTMSLLRPDRPVHLLGIGGLRDIVHGVAQGIDTFDCVHPTRLARHGGALIWPGIEDEDTTREHINLRNAKYREDERPIEATCPCQTCQTYSRAYLHHLLKAKELLSLQALTVHNVSFMNRFMSSLRESVRQKSDVRCQKSDVRNQMSDVRNQMSDVRNQMSDVRCQKSGVRNQV